jgi:phosphoglycolate phosphatase/AHBA synthesis associated protein
MDGVLVRSEETWARVVEESGARFRGRPVPREEFLPTFGQGTEADVRAFGLRCTPAELDAFYLEAFPRHAAATVWVDPAARPLLEALRAAGRRRAVVTNTLTPLARHVLEAAGLLPLLEVVACADQVPRAKPAPDLVLHACARLGVSPAEAWMVGDSRYDRGAAGAAGVRFVGLGLDGDARIESLPELAPLLGLAPPLQAPPESPR